VKLLLLLQVVDSIGAPVVKLLLLLQVVDSIGAAVVGASVTTTNSRGLSPLMQCAAAQGATGVVDGSSRAPLGNPQRLSALGSSGSQHSLNRRRSPDGHEVGPLADSSKAGSIVRSSSTQQLQAAQQVAAAALANAKAAQQHALSRSPQPEMRHVRSPPSVNATSSQARTDGLSRSQNAAWRDLVSRTRIGSPSPMPASSHPNGSNIAARGQSAHRQDQS